MGARWHGHRESEVTRELRIAVMAQGECRVGLPLATTASGTAGGDRRRTWCGHRAAQRFEAHRIA